ncbi:MAG: hypothetical protein EOP35_01755 [Rubrivivax sp.]|nr:MAG: hypothetical protein EOP35_01755 [Rubrivivax sp.]
MTALMERTAGTREELHAGVTAIYEAAKAMVAEGRRPHIELTEEGETLSLRQLRFLHGPVFRQIAEQVVVNGIRYTPKMWKTHLKDLFIPDEFEMVQAPYVRDRKTGEWRPAKRPVPRKLPKSLTSLKNEARSNFIDQVLAHAAVEWGVEFIFKFDEREAVRYQPPRSKLKKAAQQQSEAVPA